MDFRICSIYFKDVYGPMEIYPFTGMQWSGQKSLVFRLFVIYTDNHFVSNTNISLDERTDECTKKTNLKVGCERWNIREQNITMYEAT